MHKVSLIVPVYNVEKYLSKCLESVIHQTYKNLEIICVNDCSPDGSDKILNKYAQKDSRIKIINREKNGGLSAARNSGINSATGEYIYFLDSDDWIDLDYIEKMVAVALKTNSNIVLNTNIIAEYESSFKPFPWPSYAQKLPQGEFLDNVTAINNTQCMVWAHLYKKDFFDEHHLRFPEGLIHEDVYFQYVSNIYTDKVFAFYGSAYHYLQRNDSIMGLKKNSIGNLIEIFKLSYEFYKKNDLLKKYNNVKIFKMVDFLNIDKESDFCLLKEYLKYIYEDFIENPNASSEMDKFIFKTMLDAENYNQCQKKLIHNNWLLTYMLRRHQLQNKKQKISIIISVYNVQDYLKKCLDSVCNQTYKNLEIICVDDCSTDDSVKILNEYAEKDKRIRIVQRTKNGGQGAAIQSGIDVASGDYIAFVDSDDWLDNNYYEKMIDRSKVDQTDIVVNGNILVHEGEKIYPKNFPGHKQLESKIYDYPSQLIEKVFCVVWNKLFRAELLKKRKYTIPIRNAHEDVFFHYATFAFAKNISFFNGPAYHYLYRQSSISHAKYDWGVEHIKVYSQIYDFYKENNLLDKQIKLYATMPFFTIKNKEAFEEYKKYFIKIQDYMEQNKDIFNALDLFFAQSILACENYTEYVSKYSGGTPLTVFLRRKK